jgi:hypothetical protein
MRLDQLAWCFGAASAFIVLLTIGDRPLPEHVGTLTVLRTALAVAAISACVAAVLLIRSGVAVRYGRRRWISWTMGGVAVVVLAAIAG